MAETDVDHVLLERLIRSAPWREYLEHTLLPAYERAATMLDSTPQDHRYVQGLKEGLRQAIEHPYTITKQGSPLQRTQRVGTPLKPRGHKPPEEETEVPVLNLRRPSYLA